MQEECIIVEQSLKIQGEVNLSGAKNAVLVIMASTLLNSGKNILKNVPNSEDVTCMIQLLEELGAQVNFDQLNKVLKIDTSTVIHHKVSPHIMKKMRASILVMGPLLARFSKAEISLPGGCILGKRPINYHLDNFSKIGVKFEQEGDFLVGTTNKLISKRLALDYPSVGATENLMMAAVLTQGTTTIINAALEPEVLDLIEILRKMGAKISILQPATIEIEGVSKLQAVEHSILCDRLEAGSLLLAAAITGGNVYIPNASAYMLDVFLMKLEEMGHTILIGPNGQSIRLMACKFPKSVSFKTAPYPGFPTDLQAPMLVAQTLAEGVSEIEETVFENRLVHVFELQKMGAKIILENNNKAIITGVKELIGAEVVASDIRASCGLVLAGLAAQGKTIVKGVHHFKRGYDALDQKLQSLGAKVKIEKYDYPKITQEKILEI